MITTWLTEGDAGGYGGMCKAYLLICKQDLDTYTHALKAALLDSWQETAPAPRTALCT